jgi:hypothetical protein
LCLLPPTRDPIVQTVGGAEVNNVRGGIDEHIPLPP